MNFSKVKADRLKSVDFSRKGEVDAGIVELIKLINDHDSYFTTSSCSGRIIVLCEAEKGDNAVAVRKKGCQWLHVTHDLASPEKIIQAVEESIGGMAVLKFEPFVLHVQCSTADRARQMHQNAVAAGFRNSGITLGNGGKIMTAVRSTHGLEVPLTCEGRLLVSKEYLEFVVNIANSKMKENVTRIARFQEALKRLFAEPKEEGGLRAQTGKAGRKSHRKHSTKKQDAQTEREEADFASATQDSTLSGIPRPSVEQTEDSCHGNGSSDAYCPRDEQDHNVRANLDFIDGFAALFGPSEEKT